LSVPPRKPVGFLTSLSVLGGKGSFAACERRPKGFALWKPTTFEKVDETFRVASLTLEVCVALLLNLLSKDLLWITKLKLLLNLSSLTSF